MTSPHQIIIHDSLGQEVFSALKLAPFVFLGRMNGVKLQGDAMLERRDSSFFYFSVTELNSMI
jgi:hypothetical protein